MKNVDKVQNCQLCGEKLKLFKTVVLPTTGEKICTSCKDRVQNELIIQISNSSKYSLDDIHQMYKKRGTSFEGVQKQKEQFISEVESQTEVFSKFIHIVGGSNLLDTSEHSKIVQLDDSRIYFKDNYYDFYYLASLEFAGSRFKTVTSNSTKSSANTDTIEKSRKKGKSGKVATGAIIGTMLMPGIGTAVGAYAGSKGKDKKKTKTAQTTTNESHTSGTTREVEEKSTCTLELIRISDSKKISITVKADSTDYYELTGLEIKENAITPSDIEEVTREVAISKLKELKELVELGILSEEEFLEKKDEYIKYIYKII